jgi:hypothetical protein
MSKSKQKRTFEQRVRREVKKSALLATIWVIGNVLVTLIKWGAMVAIVWGGVYAWVRSTPDLAGKQTSVDLSMAAGFKLLANKWMYLLVAGLLGGGWLIERKTLRRRLGEMSEEKVELERLLDGTRSSSGMNRDGSAPED